MSYHGLNNLSYDFVFYNWIKNWLYAVLNYNHFRFSLSRFLFLDFRLRKRTGLIGSRFAFSSLWPFRYFFFQKPLERAIFTLRSQMSREHFLERFLRNLENESFISATFISEDEKWNFGTYPVLHFNQMKDAQANKTTKSEHKPDSAFSATLENSF